MLLAKGGRRLALKTGVDDFASLGSAVLVSLGHGLFLSEPRPDLYLQKLLSIPVGALQPWHSIAPSLTGRPFEKNAIADRKKLLQLKDALPNVR